MLGREKVCVTTTGLGLVAARMREEDLRELLYHCELTIDSIESLPDHVRNAEMYAALNRSESVRCVDEITNLHINVPILNPICQRRILRRWSIRFPALGQSTLTWRCCT